MSEPIESIEAPQTVTDEDIEKFLGEDGKAPQFHPILAIWKAVLEPAKEEALKPVRPEWALRVCGSYREVTFAQVPAFNQRFYTKVTELLQLLLDEIESDDECLNVHTPEEDLEHNSEHYRNMLFVWQKAVVRWENAWDPADELAGAELASIGEVYRIFFSATGIVQHLDNIKFQFTDSDRMQLAQELEALKEGHE